MIGIIDLNSGNLTSLQRAIENAGFKAKRIQKPCFDGLQSLILPGQGRFGFVMNQLVKNGFADAIKKWIDDGRSFLGICVGMQVLFSGSEENPEIPGLGLFPETVTKLDGPKRPLMGWVTVNWRQTSLPNGTAYFVNSFGVKKSSYSISDIPYGSGLVGAIRKDRLFAFQFHPEKSGPWGREILKQCLS